MVDPIAAFIEALDRVPSVLLTTDDSKVLNDAKTSAEVLRSIEGSPIAVVLFGCTGVGKSHIVNSLVKMAAAETGVLRPTTTTIVMAGRCGPANVAQASEYVFAPDAPDRLVVVDTPAPATDPEAVASAIDAADIGVLVVSPSRYADVETNDLWRDMESITQRIVALNRQRGTDQDRDVVAVSAAQRFGDTSLIEIEEDGEAELLLGEIEARTSRGSSEHGKVAIARVAACEAGRYVAAAVTAGATDIGVVADVVDSAPSPEIPDRGLAVMESWRATERELVSLVERAISDLDHHIATSAGVGLAVRIANSLEDWDEAGLETRLAAWRDDASDLFISNATIRWRRSATERLLDRASWKVGVNPDVRVPQRVSRMLRLSLDAVTSESHGQLMAVLNAAIDDRRAAWRRTVDDIGTFKPGELLASVEAMDI